MKAGFVVSLITTAAYSAYTHNVGDIVYLIYPGYRFEYHRIDYVFSRGMIISLSRGDSVYSIADSGLIANKIKENWDILKDRKRIERSSFVSDAGGLELQKDGDTVSWSDAHEYDSLSTAAMSSIRSSLYQVDSIFRNSTGRRFLDSSKVFAFANRTKSIQSRIDSITASGEPVFETIIRYYNNSCSKLNGARIEAMERYGTNFGASYECKEKYLSSKDELSVGG